MFAPALLLLCSAAALVKSSLSDVSFPYSHSIDRGFSMKKHSLSLSRALPSGLFSPLSLLIVSHRTPPTPPPCACTPFSWSFSLRSSRNQSVISSFIVAFLRFYPLTPNLRCALYRRRTLRFRGARASPATERSTRRPAVDGTVHLAFQCAFCSRKLSLFTNVSIQTLSSSYFRSEWTNKLLRNDTCKHNDMLQLATIRTKA